MGASFDEEISPRSEIYNNIFNIVNPSDIVTMVAPSYLGFTRYGVDHYLPASNLEESYKSQLEKILSFSLLVLLSNVKRNIASVINKVNIG